MVNDRDDSDLDFTASFFSNLIMKAALLIVLLTASGAFTSIPAQQKAWRVQSPCNNNFSVKVPVPLYEVGWFEGKHGPSLEPDEEFDKGGAAYVALQATPKKRQFGVVVQDVPVKDRPEYRKGEFGGSYFVIGGDDATPTRERVVHVNGLTGREYVYAKEITLDTFTRGRIFYTGGRLYIVVFVASTPQDLMSPEANRFLDSFRVRRPTGSGTRAKR